MKRARIFALTLGAALLAGLIGLAACESWLVRQRLGPVLEANAARTRSLWPDVEADLLRLSAHPFFLTPRGGGDAGELLNSRLTWDLGDEEVKGALTSAMDAWPPPLSRLAETGGVHEALSPEARADLQALDFSWMRALLDYGHWSFVAARPASAPKLDAPLLVEPTPDLSTLSRWARLRLARGDADGALDEAAREVEHLAWLALSTENLVGAMTGMGLLKLVRERAPAHSSFDAEALARATRLFFGAPSFTRPSTPDDLRERFDALAGAKLPLLSCVAWSEAAMEYALRSFFPDRFEAYYRALDDKRPGEGCRFEALARTRQIAEQAPWALLGGVEGAEELGWARLPFFRGIIGATLMSVAAPDFLRRYDEPLPAPVAGGARLPFLEDDLEGALRLAAARDVPLIVDLWAPWCHTCLSMQAFVLTDPRVLARQNDAVWLALDTDKPKNAAALERLPQSFWPTFYALAPDGRVLARHAGAASVEQLLAFLDRAQKTGDRVLERLRSADAALAEGDAKAAARDYEAALEAGGSAWEGRFSARVALLEALRRAGDIARCAAIGRATLADMAAAQSASAADFTALAAACSRAEGTAAHATLLKAATAEDGPLRMLLSTEGAALSADDRSDALRILRELEDEQGRSEEARRLAEEQRRLLDASVRALTDPKERMTFHWPRVEVYTYLGEGEALIEELRESASALPAEYDPPYRLAWLLLRLGRANEAEAPAARAAKLAYGPRKARALSLLADVHNARGDRAEERAARASLVTLLEALPAHQRDPRALEDARAKLAALTAP